VVNHIRTLLLNEDGSGKPGYAFPLEEYVPTDFKSSKMTFDCFKIWRTLFGSEPDRAYKNWRLYQLSTLAEASSLLKHWSKFDDRITHFGKDKKDRSLEYGRVTITRDATSSNISYFEGDGVIVVDKNLSAVNQTDSPEIIGVYARGVPTANETKGSCLSYWKIDLNSSDEIDVQCLNDKTIRDSHSLVFTQGLSQDITLPGTNVTLQFRDVGATTWTVDIVARPSKDIGTVLADLDNTASTDISAIMSGAYSEYKTFSDYWNYNQDTAERLTAITLALAYKLEEKRLQS
jgi:hypothetical protein